MFYLPLIFCFRFSNEEVCAPQNMRLCEVDSSSYVNMSHINSNVAKKRQNIFFLKAHKCGSSTVQNILLRYGRDNNLLFLLPSKEQSNYIGNPKPFDRSLIDENLRSVDDSYNIFTHHSRYNPIEVKKVMKPNAAFVTILRDPGTLFESMFNFYYFDRRLNVTFEEFKKDPDKYADLLIKRNKSRYGRNQMCFDLGLEENRFFSDQFLEDFIKNIEHDFDIVMISEHMEVSLILLADLMGWSLDQIRFFRNNVRQPSMKTNLTEADKQKLRNINQADTKLYNYFFEVFKAKIKTYGFERMKHQVEKLISMNHDLYHLCVDEVNTKGYAATYSYSIKPGAPIECFYAGKTELSFTKQLREEQIYKLAQLRKLVALMSNEGNSQVFNSSSETKTHSVNFNSVNY